MTTHGLHTHGRPSRRFGGYLLALHGLGCTMSNPAFDEPGEASVADGPETADAESGEETPGDGDPGDGDPGDGDPGDGDGEPGDGDGEPGDGDGEPGDGDGEPSCNPPLAMCDGDCVDLDSDEAHCGGCGQPCEGTCEGGSCLPEPHRIVFVSSMKFNGALGGFQGADTICTELAGDAALDGSFMAWLSTAQVGPADRMTPFMGPYRLPNGVLIAENWEDLTDGVLAHPIDSDENGALAPASGVCQGKAVWTNSNPDGTPLNFSDCQGWTSEDLSATSNAGLWSEFMFPWSLSGCVMISCSEKLPLYCIQQ